MKSTPVSLDVIHVPRPCPASWDEMRGNARVRFCGQCRMNVYNLSEMPREDAERLVNEHEGRLCVQFYRRKDGTILTADCRGGWRFAARRLGRFATAAVCAALAVVLAPFGYTIASSTDGQIVRGEAPSIPTTQPIPDDDGDVIITRGKIAVLGEPVATSQPTSQPTTQPAQSIDTE